MLERMSYIFFYVADLARAREFYEKKLALPVTEEDEHSVKYDCGSLMLALNVVPGLQDADRVPSVMMAVTDVDSRKRDLERQGVPTDELERGSFSFSDPDGHRIGVTAAAAGTAAGPPRIAQVRLSVPDLAAAEEYYRLKLGLVQLARQSEDIALQYQAGGVRISVTAGPARDDPAPPLASYVFHADDCGHEALTLRGRGVEVSEPRASAIGVTARFNDLGGNDFFLYEPSREALSWPSGSVYTRIIQAKLDSSEIFPE
jgi:catechol 2,3-dioxygenase-like lactoylglutathione lyase family enzyme